MEGLAGPHWRARARPGKEARMSRSNVGSDKRMIRAEL